MTMKKAISVFKNVLWVGRATVFVVGLAVTLAMVLGVATAAFGANGGSFILGKTNVATAITRLAGTQGVDGAMFEVKNKNADANDTALSLKVQAGEPPMKVNSSTMVANLNADKIDNLDSTDFQSANAQADGDLSGNYPNPQIAAGVVGATEMAPLPAVYASPLSLSIPPNTPTLLQLPDEDFDQGGAGQSSQMHTTTTNNSHLTAPQDGIYQIDAQVGWGTNTTGVREAFLIKNANGDCTSANTDAFDRVNATEFSSAYNHLGTLLALNQGDYVEVCVYQTSGTNRSISSYTFVAMHYVSPR